MASVTLLLKITIRMETVLYYFQHYYYSSLLLYLATSIALLYTYKFRFKIPDFPYFYFFPLLSLIQQTISIGSPLLPLAYSKIIVIFNNSLINFFVGFETIFLMIFYSAYFRKQKNISKVIYFQIFTFLPIFFTTELISNYSFNNKYIYSFGSVTLILSSLRYFYYILKNPTVNDLLKRPVFWISCAILVTYGCLAPITIVLEELSTDESKPYDSRIYSIIYILYTILFTFISKAYSCPKTDKL